MAGVSKTTVSRVLNEKPDVDPDTRKKILDLIDQYDFQPNAFAKAISLQKSHHIGLIIPHEAEYIFSNPFYTEVMRGVSTEVDCQGYYMVLCYAHEINYLDIFRQKRVDGFVLLSPGSFHKHIIESLNEEGVPFVSTAKISDEPHMTYVDVDNYYGATLAMEHLVSLGHRHIAYIGKPTLQSSIDRMNGYIDVMKRHNIHCCDEWVVVSETSSTQSGYEHTCELLNRPNRPTAIFLANDVMAFGALKAAKDCGLRVPEDLSIVGFDDIPLASFASPALTTVRQPTLEKGMLSARALINWLKTDEQPASLILNLDLVVRQSTGTCTDQ